ncbi:hypothetical protein BG20_I1810 [Candidatus Nitrosarchaeum limnium BG20]|uniref:Uncharacterized protein n=1 Tax=Candidatus Nitrosarchaeum limnium BG20 TaxID=859192 RepID=S2ENQ0_9ARCH|nr:hypothetical protein BG20_I1810 [Candidatus Nitrosarchaeum limnium BG20]
MSKNKGIIKNNIVKNILKGYGLLFLGLIVVGITSASFTHDEVNIKPEKVNEEIKNKLPSKISEIIPSKMGNGWYQTDEQEVYYDHAEKLLEKYVLTYKGKDHVGLDMQDAMLIALTNKCGFDVMLDKSNTETWVSVSDELDNKDKLTVMMNTKSDVLCANTPAYWFDVYLHTGKITSESDSLGGSQILLDYLDTSN